MCWCLRVYWTVLHNLFVRFVTNVGNSFYNNQCCCCCCCCCCNCRQKHKQTKLVSDPLNAAIAGGSAANVELRTLTSSSTTIAAPPSASLNHEYVIVDDVDANYLELERRKIETESYYLIVDRKTAEDMLAGREDGSCLVRPYKECDIIIKYIVSIYAQKQYFHLFIRRICDDLYGVGQKKHNEKLFTTPSDIIEFYSCYPLQCTNKSTTLKVKLKPIVA